jgi:Protein of unknown function (DUF2465)
MKQLQFNIKLYFIIQVPDRGGRPSEQIAPPKEMPSWQSNRSTDGGGRGGGGNLIELQILIGITM